VKSGPTTTVVDLNDITGSVPTVFFRSALDLMAAAVTASVAQGQGRLTVYVRAIAHDSFDQSAALATVTVPAVSRLAPPPPPCNPYDSSCPAARSRAIVAAKRALAVRLAAAEAAAASAERTIEQLSPAMDETYTDVVGGIAKGAQLLSGVTGRRILVIASDLIQQGPTGGIPALNLNGVVVLLMQSCHTGETAASCEYLWSMWRAALLQAGASRVLGIDPSQGPGVVAALIDGTKSS
jgi:hypothetical protein